MSKPNESDRTPDKAEKAPEKGTEAEQKTAADSQAEAPKAVAADQLKNLRSFLDRGTMTGLAGMKVKEGSEFKITGLEQYKDGDARGKALAELHEFDSQGGARRQVEKVSEDAPAAKGADKAEHKETKGEATPKQPEAGKDASPEKEVQGKPEARKEAEARPEAPRDPETGEALPSKITYKDGTTAKVTYEDGQPQKIEFSNGKEMVNNGDGTWTMSDKNTGKSDTYDVDVKVSPDGTITEKAPDGASMKIGTDKSRVITDAEGRTASVTYPDGFSAEITRDEKGEPTRIDYSNDTSLVKNENGTWSLTDADGNEIANYKDVKEAGGQIAVTNDEGYTNRRNPDGTEDTIDPEGNVRRKYPDNSQEIYNADLDRTSYTSPSGREFKDNGDSLEYTVKPGDNPWNIVKDSLKAEGNPNPSNAEIAAELKRIEKETGRDMDETIYAGDKFEIPKKGASERGKGDTITYPDGFSATPKYGPDGELTEVEYSNDTRLTKNEDGTWDLQDGNGDTIATYKDVTVDADGKISVTDFSGAVSSRSPDGTETTSRKVTYPDGFSAEVTYDKEGNPERIDYSNNTSLERTPEGKYALRDANGDIIATYKDVDVSPDGAVSITDESGSVSTRNTDGSELTTGEGQRPERITYPDGFSADPKYGPDGSLSEIDYSNDTKLSRNADGTWDLKDANGDTIATYKDVSITPDGGISVTNENGNVATRYPNGREVTASDTETVVKSPDGTTMTYKHTPDGRVTEITSSSEPPIKYDEASESYVFYDNDGKPITEGVLAPQKIKVSIDKRGVVTTQGQDGTRVATSPSGVETQEQPEKAAAAV
jgi:YD repeat-containing protein